MMGGIETDVAEERTSGSMATIFPNPATTEVTIAIPAETSWSSIRIVDVTGRIMETRSIDPAMRSCLFDVSIWSGGVYIYQLVTPGRMTSGHFIIR